MANYNIVVDTSNFKPMDISMGWKVLEANKDTYEKLSDKLEKIAEENGEFQLPEGTMYGDIDLSQKVKDLQNEIATTAYDINNNMSARTRGKAQQFFMRYKKEMTPIKKMVESYNKDIEKLKTLEMNDPSLIRVYTPEIGSYYGGVENSKIKMVSGQQVAKDTTTTVGSTLRSQAQKLGLSQTDIRGTLKVIKESNISAEDLYNIARNPSYARTVNSNVRAIAQVVANTIDDVRQANGYYHINNPEQKQKFDAYMRMGVLAALTPADVNIASDSSEDYKYKYAALAQEAALQRERIAASMDEGSGGTKKKNKKDKLTTYYYNTDTEKIYSEKPEKSGLSADLSGGTNDPWVEIKAPEITRGEGGTGAIVRPRSYNRKTGILTYEDGSTYNVGKLD